jgi:hypothetical protein
MLNGFLSAVFLTRQQPTSLLLVAIAGFGFAWCFVSDVRCPVSSSWFLALGFGKSKFLCLLFVLVVFAICQAS